MNERAPDFDKLVGPEVESPDRERLLRVHELLVAAGPPPELASTLSSAPAVDVERLQPRRRRAALLALAAAFAAAMFGLGFLVGNGGGPSVDRVVAMAGTGAASGASASIEIFAVDDAGNWPMELSIDGLAPSASGRLYQLWLTREGRPAALCGSFLVEHEGTTVVPMNAPWRLLDFDGWVIVEEGSTTPLLTT